MKTGGGLSPLIYNFALDYAIRLVQTNLKSLKLNSIPQFLVYTDDVNMSCWSIYTVLEDKGVSMVAGKGFGLEVNVEKSKYMFLSLVQIGGKFTT